ncbi:MAG: sugar phosphate isomerase/epimerase [Caldilineaceae bacterium]|nr:sugar phosphate isomerase/epimerase [Caldilineaceae bacterium]
MMKFAFMSFSCPELTLAEMLSLARNTGYDGIEPRAGSNHNHGVELTADAATRRALREQVTESEIEICCLATSCRYADPETVQAEIDSTLRYIDLAADVGAPRLRVFGGKIGVGVLREAAIDNVAQALAAVANHAQDRGITICLETHDDWCNPAHVAAVMTQVNHPAIAVNWDIMHPVRAGGATMESAHDILQPWIQHVHVHDGSTRLDKLEMLPIGTGDINHFLAIELLHADNYTGYLSGEWINWEPYAVHLPRELAQLEIYLAEIALEEAA